MPDALIVPMSVDAFLNTEKMAKDSKILNRRTSGLEDVMMHAPGGPAQSAQSGTATDGALGVYVQWELPAILRTGQTPASTAASGLELSQPADFPLIPNRWLITRRSYYMSGGTTDTKSWLIRTDTLAATTESSATGSRVEPDGAPAASLPGPPDGAGGYPTRVSYGTVFPLGVGSVQKEPHTWDDKSASPLFLTVDSSSLPEFCSYQPYNQNVLSFHDLQDDLTAAQGRLKAGKLEITVNYLVIGWYSHGASDLFHFQDGKQYLGRQTLQDQKLTDLQEALQKCGWDLPKTDGINICGTVYYGSVLGLPWKEDIDPASYTRPTGGAPFSLDGQPLTDQVHLAVGQSSVEACTTVVTQSSLLSHPEARHFSAFLSNLLESPSKPGVPDHTREITPLHALQYGEHATVFGSSPGGRRWHLTAGGEQKIPPSDPKLKALFEKVSELNRKQAKYEQADLDIQDMITRLKGIWWSLMPYAMDDIAEELTPPNNDITKAKSAVDTLNSALAARAKNRSDLLTEIKSASTSISDGLKKDELPYTLRPAPMPPYQKSGNPVIVLQNLLAKRRVNEMDGYLSDRLKIRNLPVNNPQAPTDPPGIDKLATPPALACIKTITDEFEKNLTDVLAGLSDDKINGPSIRGSEGTGVIGTNPTDNPYQRWWNQPWKPVFLEWYAEVYPSTLKGDAKTHENYYTFTTKDPVGYIAPEESNIPQYFHESLTGTSRPIKSASVRRLHGFSMAHPLLEDHTRYRLRRAKDLAQSEGAPEAYEKLDKNIEDHAWNLTSVTLTGVNEAFAGRKPDVSIPLRSVNGKPLAYTPPTDMDQFCTPDRVVVTAPVPHLPLQSINLDGETATKTDDKDANGDQRFSPVRSGQLNITVLTVQDSFGRQLFLLDTQQTGEDAIRNTLQISPSMHVIKQAEKDTRTYTNIEGNGPINSAALIDLRPRLHQGARLRYDYLVPRNGLAQPTPLNEVPDPATANPIHGWLMVARTGRRHALMCYDPQGTPLFDLHCLSSESPATARPLPGSPYTDVTDPKFSTEHFTLHAFITPLLDKNPTKGHLASLLSSLEQSLPHTAPPAADGPDGTRLALFIGRPIALATARLSLELDGPPLRATDKLTDAAGTPSEKYPVALGSPLLYTDGLLGYFTDTTFTTLHTHYPVKDQKTAYTTLAAAGDVKLTPQDGTRDATEYKDITLLIAPHNSTHATIDILPTVALTLPPHTLDNILTAIQPTIPLGPLLTPPPPSDAPALEILAPAHTRATTWKWTEPTPQTGIWTKAADIANPSPTSRTLTQSAEAHTGYLQLAPDQEPQSERT
ncbi:hypothetical protein [Streptomyces sp. NPDC002537]